MCHVKVLGLRRLRCAWISQTNVTVGISASDETSWLPLLCEKMFSVCEGIRLRWQLPKWLISYSWASTAEKVCCKLLQDTSWDLETPEKTELDSDTLEQSLLLWLNVVKHETTQLLQCLDERFLVYFSCVKFCLLCASCDRISSTIELYEPMCRVRV